MDTRVYSRVPGAFFVVIGLMCLLFPLWVEAGPVSLWSVEKEEGEAWLLGSIHAMKDDMLPLPSSMTDALLHADTLVVEINMLALDEAEVQSVILGKGFYSPSDRKDIVADLQPVTLKLLRSYLKSNGMNLDSIREMRPWFAGINIGMSEMTKRGFDPNLGIDLQLMKIASSTGKNIVELETFEEQMTLLAADDAEIQDLALRAMLEDIGLMDTFLDRLTAAWKLGDADGMVTLSLEGEERYPLLASQSNRLINKRNLKMAKKIEGLMKKPGNVLIVVGALHMGGEQGLLRLLGRNHDIKQSLN